MLSFVSFLNRFFTGPAMVLGVLIAGILLSFKTHFVQLFRFRAALHEVFSQMFHPAKGKKNGISPFQAVTAALSGTLGTGNIAGVGAALSLGGAGALFWMWVAAFFGMAIKYSEIVLAMTTRKRIQNGYLGGAMYYLSLLPGGKALAHFFAVFCIGASFFMGNMVQSNTAAAAFLSTFSLPDRTLHIIFLLVAVFVAIVIVGGIQRIARVTELLIPAMAVFYLSGCVLALMFHADQLLPAFRAVFLSAFSLKSISGGALGTVMARSMRVGFTRGVFTNEAGLGSAPIAHAAAENPVPAKQGYWGIFEVFFDTIVMCTLTGLVILTSGIPISFSNDGAAVTLTVFEKSLGRFAPVLVGLSTFVFAVATIIGWSYYGEACVRYLHPNSWGLAFYHFCYVIAVYIGAVSSMEIIWGFADFFNGLMMAVNLFGVILLSNRVKTETESVLLKTFQKSCKIGRKQKKMKENERI